MKHRPVIYSLIATGALLGAAVVRAQPAGHGVHPPLPDQEFYLQCRLHTAGAPTVVEALVKLPSPSAPAELHQTVELPAPLAPLQLKRYLPQALLEQNVVPADGPQAVPAVGLSIDGPKQSFQRWLVANDPQRNRLVSFIATWRYMRVGDPPQRDELFAQFTEELIRPPKLRVSRLDGTDEHELAVRVGSVHTLDDLGCTLRIRSFYSHFGIDKDNAEPVNQSDKRLNPAVLVELEYDGEKEDRWAFAKFPDFSMHTSEAVPVRIRLDCPVEQTRAVPDFAVVTIGEALQEVWTRHAGKTVSKRVALDEPVEIPGSSYTFRIARFVPAGKLIEDYRAGGGRGATAALQLETIDASGERVVLWLPLGKQRVVSTTAGLLQVGFGPRRPPTPERHAPVP
jgi:hypothetical protein